MDCVNYVGNVEGRDLMYGDIDVMVCDGFTGNIAMKACEGCGKSVSSLMKKAYKKNLWTLLCAAMSKGIIKNIPATPNSDPPTETAISTHIPGRPMEVPTTLG